MPASELAMAMRPNCLRAARLGVLGIGAAVAEGIVFGRIAVRPAVDRDAGDVAGRIEAARPKHLAELFADVAFESFERRGEKFGAARLVLFALRQSGLGRRAHHMHQHRRRGIARAFVIADIDWLVERKEVW